MDQLPLYGEMTLAVALPMRHSKGNADVLGSLAWEGLPKGDQSGEDVENEDGRQRNRPTPISGPINIPHRTGNLGFRKSSGSNPPACSLPPSMSPCGDLAAHSRENQKDRHEPNGRQLSWCR